MLLPIGRDANLEDGIDCRLFWRGKEVEPIGWSTAFAKLVTHAYGVPGTVSSFVSYRAERDMILDVYTKHNGKYHTMKASEVKVFMLTPQRAQPIIYLKVFK